MSSSIADLRRSYTLRALDIDDVDPDPLKQFQVWFDDILKADIPEPNAMTLATATPDGTPSARMVLLKGLDEQGFAFYSNFESRKGQELAANPKAALVFWWVELERQVRIEGRVERIDAEEADQYFHSRPLGSRLGAWASPQSQVISTRDILEQQLSQLESEYQNQPVPRPPHWGGYRVIPQVIEFWQGRPNRLHDRLRYTKQGEQWQIERLAP